jgi:transcriptional regulator with XRE-family HTH domain
MANRYREAKKFSKFSDWLRVNSRALQLSVTEVSNLSGLSLGYVSQLMTGYSTTPSLGTVEKFVELFGGTDLDEVWDLCD